MSDLQDGEAIAMQGSGSKPYVLKNIGGVYSCSCPAWRNQSAAIERRTCKHLRKLRGDASEEARLGSALPERAVKAKDAAEAPPLLLAERWDGNANLAGWWLSEKLDGVRAYWDSCTGCLLCYMVSTNAVLRVKSSTHSGDVANGNGNFSQFSSA